MTVEEELNAWNFWEDSRYAFAPSVAAAVSLAGEASGDDASLGIGLSAPDGGDIALEGDAGTVAGVDGFGVAGASCCVGGGGGDCVVVSVKDCF